MSRGPEGPGGPPTKRNPKTTIGLGACHCSLSMCPEGLAMPGHGTVSLVSIEPVIMTNILLGPVGITD